MTTIPKTATKTFARQESFGLELELLKQAHRGGLSYPELVQANVAVTGFEFVAAKQILLDVQAIDKNDQLTQLGWEMEPILAGQYNIGPRLATALLAARDLGCAYTVATLAAILAAETPFFSYRRDDESHGLETHSQYQLPGSKSDLTTLFNAFTQTARCEAGGGDLREYTERNSLSLRAYNQAQRIQNWLLGTMDWLGWIPVQELGLLESEGKVTEAFFHGYYRRLLYREWDKLVSTSADYLARTPPDSLQAEYGKGRSDLVLAVGLIYHRGSPNSGGCSYGALAAIEPERVRELLGDDRVWMERYSYQFDGTNSRVTCHENWQLGGETFCKRFWQPAPSCPESAAVLARAFQQGLVQKPSSPEYVRYQRALVRAPADRLSAITDNQILASWAARFTASGATRAADVPPSELSLGWAELSELGGVDNLEAMVGAVEREYPDSVVIAEQPLPVSYSTSGITVKIKGLTAAGQLLSTMTDALFPAAWKDSLVIEVEAEHGVPLCGPVTNLDHLRRLVACRQAAQNLPSETEPLRTAADRIVQVAPVQHPGRTETLYVVAGSPTYYNAADVGPCRTRYLRLRLERHISGAGSAICPGKRPPAPAEIATVLDQALAMITYQEGGFNPTLDSVVAAVAWAEETTTARVELRRQRWQALIQESRLLERYARNLSNQEAAVEAHRLLNLLEIGTIPYTDVLAKFQEFIDALRQSLPELDESARAKMLLQFWATEMTRRADRGYGDAKHVAKQSISRFSRLLAQVGLAEAQAMMPEVERLVGVAETSTATSGLKGGLSGKPTNKKTK